MANNTALRTKARELAFKLVFEDTFGTNTAKEMFGGLFEEENGFIDLDEAKIEYINWARDTVREHREELDGIISSFSKGWTVERMSRVDLSLLRLALCEILYRTDITPPIAINEAVELAKKYSGEESPGFINGILGAYVRSL